MKMNCQAVYIHEPFLGSVIGSIAIEMRSCCKISNRLNSISFCHYCSDIPELNFYTTEQLVVLRKELGEYLDAKSSSSLKQVRPRRIVCLSDWPLLIQITTSKISFSTTNDKMLYVLVILKYCSFSTLASTTVLIGYKNLYTRHFLMQSLPLLSMIQTVSPAQLLMFITEYAKMIAEDEKIKNEKPKAKTFISYDEMTADQAEIVDALCEEHEDFTPLLATQAVNELGFNADEG